MSSRISLVTSLLQCRLQHARQWKRGTPLAAKSSFSLSTGSFIFSVTIMNAEAKREG